MSHPHDHPFGGEAHRLDRRAGDIEHPVECSGDAHVCGLLGSVVLANPNLERGAATCASFKPWRRSSNRNPTRPNAVATGPIDPHEPEEGNIRLASLLRS